MVYLFIFRKGRKNVTRKVLFWGHTEITEITERLLGAHGKNFFCHTEITEITEKYSWLLAYKYSVLSVLINAITISVLSVLSV